MFAILEFVSANFQFEIIGLKKNHHLIKTVVTKTKGNTIYKPFIS